MSELRILGWIAVCMACGLGGMGRTLDAAPERILFIGDSMMRAPAHSLELRLARQDGIDTHAYTSLGSGLARLDVFDWMAKIDELVETFDPQWTFVWFGTNDRQPMRTDGGVIHPHNQAAWEDEYTKRVTLVMDKLTAMPGSRVIWLGLPAMREARLQQDITLINALVAAAADVREAVVFYSTEPLFSRRPGVFSSHVAGPDGMPLRVRDADGVHLNRSGSDWLADHVLQEFFAP